MNLTSWIFHPLYRLFLTDNRNQFQKVFPVQVIRQQQVNQGEETEYLEHQQATVQSAQVKSSQHKKTYH